MHDDNRAVSGKLLLEGNTGFVIGSKSLDVYSLSAHIKTGSVGIVGADSSYCLIGSALSEAAAFRIKEIISSNSKEPLVIFISDIEHMRVFGVEITKELSLGIKTFWPGNYNIFTPTNKKENFGHLLCDLGNLCFHMPDSVGIFELIDLTGPIVASHINLKNGVQFNSMDNVQRYFGDSVDFYCDMVNVKNPNKSIVQFVSDCDSNSQGNFELNT